MLNPIVRVHIWDTIDFMRWVVLPVFALTVVMVKTCGDVVRVAFAKTN